MRRHLRGHQPWKVEPFEDLDETNAAGCRPERLPVVEVDAAVDVVASDQGLDDLSLLRRGRLPRYLEVDLDAEPAKVNADAAGEGWLFKMTLADAGELDDLMSADDYSGYVEGLG